MIRQRIACIVKRDSSKTRMTVASAIALGVSIALAAATVRWGWIPLAFAAAVAFGLVTALSPHLLVAAVVFAISLSPELPVLGLPLRIEDFLLPLGIILLWARFAVRRLSGPRVPLWQPWLALLLVEAGATLIGVVQGTATLDLTVYSGLIFLAKSVETFLLYVVVVWSLDTQSKVRMYVWVLLVGGACLGVFGMVTHLTGNVPMEAVGTDPFLPVVDIEGGATYSIIAGALTPPLALGLSLWLAGERQGRWAPLALLVPIVYSILFSLSRQWYVGVVTLVCFALWMRSKRLFLLAIPLLLLILWLAPLFIPEPVLERASSILDPITAGEAGLWVYRTRLNAWRYRFPEMWRTNPFTGRGLASRPPGFLDSQYLVALYYTGFVGLGIFLWLVGSFGKQARRLYDSARRPLGRALGLAALSTVVAFVVTGLGGMPFVAVRIRGMFWLLMAGTSAYLNLIDDGVMEGDEGPLS